MTRKTKIVKLGSLKRIVKTLRRRGRRIAFTNGCFDLLHYGHVHYLIKAKRKNRVLIVGLNSDRSVKRLKGKNRPLVPARYRAGVLAALECVDYVTIFNEDTPQKTIQALKPDILIKGADWKGKTVVGSDLVKRVELIRYLKGLSTTQMIQTIVKKCKR